MTRIRARRAFGYFLATTILLGIRSEPSRLRAESPRESDSRPKPASQVARASLESTPRLVPLPAPHPLVLESLLKLHNEVRARQGIIPFKHHPKLSAAAQRFAEFSFRKRKFGHQSDGRSPADRIAAEGVKHGSWAENIALGQTTPAEAMHTWLNSTGHRRNILSPHTHVGFGQMGGVWVTVFADILEEDAAEPNLARKDAP